MPGAADVPNVVLFLQNLGDVRMALDPGKKFIGDPTVWEIVDGKLYMNLDPSIKVMWREDIPGNIKKADKNWTKIMNKAPQDL